MATVPFVPVQFPVHPEPEPRPAVVTRKAPVKLNGSLARNAARLGLVEQNRATAANRAAASEEWKRDGFWDFMVGLVGCTVGFWELR